MTTDRQQVLEATAEALQSGDLSTTRARAAVRAAAESALATMDAIDQITDSRGWAQLVEIFPGIEIDDLFDALEALGDRYDGDGVPVVTALSNFWADLVQALPYIPEALGDRRMTLTEAVTDPAVKNLYSDCLARAQNAPHIRAAKISALTYPLDKVNETIWQTLSPDDRHSDGYFHISTAKTGARAKTDVHILYDIDFAEEEKRLNEQLATITGRIPVLTTRAKRTMIAANELYKHGDIFSRTQLYHAMGGAGRPSANSLDAINQDLDLLLSPIKLDNCQEINAGYKYSRIRYVGPLIPHERISAWIDGVLVADAVHLFRQPPLMAFAEGRNQITTVPLSLLASSKRKTPGNMQIEDYLIQRIARMKNNDSVRRKILYQTVFEKCGVTGRMQKSRVKNTISEFLTHYKEQGYIKDFVENKDGVIIKF